MKKLVIVVLVVMFMACQHSILNQVNGKDWAYYLPTTKVALVLNYHGIISDGNIEHILSLPFLARATFVYKVFENYKIKRKTYIEVLTVTKYYMEHNKKESLLSVFRKVGL